MSRLKVAIIGFGRAGQARLKALSTIGIDQLVVVTKRPHELEQFIQLNGYEHMEAPAILNWQEVLDDPLLQAVFVCSENALHYEQIKAALNYKKHVCVEFPLCASLTQAQELYALAKKNNRILHVECIGTISSRHQELKHLYKSQHIRRLEFDFTGSLYRWVLEEVNAKRFAELAFGRLYQCIDLFDEVKLVDAHLEEVKEQKTQGYLLKLDMIADQQGNRSILIKLTEHRQSEAKRSSQVRAYAAHEQIHLAPLQRSPLFLQDSKHFLALIQSHHKQGSELSSDPRYIQGYASQNKILSTYALIQSINKSLKQNNLPTIQDAK